MAQGPLTFSATVEEHWLVVPVSGMRQWGEARPRVVALINGHQYRQRLAVHGGETVLGITDDVPGRGELVVPGRRRGDDGARRLYAVARAAARKRPGGTPRARRNARLNAYTDV